MDSGTALSDAALRYWQLGLTILLSIALTVTIFLLVRTILNRHYLRRRKLVWIEITPPSSINKTPKSTDQLFAVIHGTRTARSLKEKLLGRSLAFSFEITSTRKE